MIVWAGIHFHIVAYFLVFSHFSTAQVAMQSSEKHALPLTKTPAFQRLFPDLKTNSKYSSQLKCLNAVHALKSLSAIPRMIANPRMVFFNPSRYTIIKQQGQNELFVLGVEGVYRLNLEEGWQCKTSRLDENLPHSDSTWVDETVLLQIPSLTASLRVQIVISRKGGRCSEHYVVLSSEGEPSHSFTSDPLSRAVELVSDSNSLQLFSAVLEGQFTEYAPGAPRANLRETSGRLSDPDCSVWENIRDACQWTKDVDILKTISFQLNEHYFAGLAKKRNFCTESTNYTKNYLLDYGGGKGRVFKPKSKNKSKSKPGK